MVSQNSSEFGIFLTPGVNHTHPPALATQHAHPDPRTWQEGRRERERERERERWWVREAARVREERERDRDGGGEATRTAAAAARSALRHSPGLTYKSTAERHVPIKYMRGFCRSYVP
jgi:hypothetical protein